MACAKKVFESGIFRVLRLYEKERLQVTPFIPRHLFINKNS